MPKWAKYARRNHHPTVTKDNCWRRHFAPQLKLVGLDWVNFQVMRRTHSSLLNELDVDSQVRAEQMGIKLAEEAFSVLQASAI